MVITNRSRMTQKESGGRYKGKKKKRIYEKGNLPTNTRLDKQKIKNVSTKGGGIKTKIYFADVINVLDPKTKKYAKVKIKTVVETPSNRHYVRRNIMSKGTIVDTEKGKAKITSRPGQDGTVNAILI